MPTVSLLAGDILRRTAQRLPDKTAILWGETSTDYRALDRDADRFANALIARGIARGDRVAIMSANRPEYAIAFYGAARAGAVLANLNARAVAKDVARILKLTEAKTVVVEAGLLPVIAEARPEAPALVHVIAFGDGGAAAGGAETLASMLEGAAATAPDVAIAETDPMGLTFTGGTTGLPKGVLVSHRARGTSARAALAAFGLAEDDIAAMTTPLFHTAGLFVWFHAAMMCGATAVMAPRWEVESFMADVARYGITAAVLVPTQINDLVKHPAFDPQRLRSLRKINHAGMPMPHALIERIAQLMPWIGLTDNYGSSEACPLTARRPEHLPAKAHSVGRPIPGVALEIRGPDGMVLPPGEVGEVATKGDHLMLGYYRDEAATAAAFKSNDGWLWTGDLGYFDPDGFLVLVDRSKDVINQGGENIFPLEIEQVLYRHPAVRECAVFGIPDERLGEVPAAHVALKPDASASECDLVEFCLLHLARHKRPRLVKFVESLPKTAVGKILKHKMREPYWAGQARRI